MDALVPLRLPNARTAELVGDGDDLTVVQPLQASGGDSERAVECALWSSEGSVGLAEVPALQPLCASAKLIEPDGSLTELPDWETRKGQVEQGKGWEDLLREPGRATRD
jgi:hypothetical protein